MERPMPITYRPFKIPMNILRYFTTERKTMKTKTATAKTATTKSKRPIKSETRPALDLRGDALSSTSVVGLSTITQPVPVTGLIATIEYDSDTIRMRAYLLYERRMTAGVSGSPESDWHE